MNQKTADRLVELRKNAGYSQEELADTIGVSRQAVSKWERCESSPDTDNLIELARLYKVSLDELINGTDLPPKAPRTEETEQVAADTDAFVWEDDGITVAIKEKEVSVKNEDGEEKTYDAEYLRKKDLKEKRVNTTVSSLVALLAVVGYLLLGFCVKSGKGWTCGWPLFLAIPVASSIVSFIFYKRIALLNYPCVVVGIYCFVGMYCGIWHPTWVMFITIPVFYIIAEKIDRMIRTRDYAAIKNAYGKKDGKNPGHKGKDGFNR
ncbi:MAG: helix-turn-helix transcriptional regulator [Clostridia bacterium]|nr:helix-turn-helix transcriptional regulator [Clostridia bacterium]